MALVKTKPLVIIVAILSALWTGPLAVIAASSGEGDIIVFDGIAFIAIFAILFVIFMLFLLPICVCIGEFGVWVLKKLFFRRQRV